MNRQQNDETLDGGKAQNKPAAVRNAAMASHDTSTPAVTGAEPEVDEAQKSVVTACQAKLGAALR